MLALAVVRAIETPGWRAGVGLALAIAAVLFVHPVAGVALGVAAIAGAVWAAVAVPESRRALASSTAAVVCGAALMAPYLVAVAGGGAGGGASGALAWGLAADARGFVSALVAGAFLILPLLWRGGLFAAATPWVVFGLFAASMAAAFS